MVKKFFFFLLLIIYPGSVYSEGGQRLCTDYPLAFDSCLVSFCQAQYKFGTAYHQISGIDKHNNCIYYEEVEDLGGIKCTIPPAILTEFAENVSDYIKMMTSGDAVAAEVSAGILRLHNQYCVPFLWPHIKNDGAFNRDLAENPQILPLSEEENPLLKPKSKTLNSVIFNQQEINNIKQAVSQYEGSVTGQIINHINQATDTQNSYFLQSILYLDDDNWVIWLNNRKLYSDQQQEKGLKISNINSNGLMLELEVENLDLMSPGWHNKAKLEDKDYVIESNNIRIYNKDNKYMINVPLGLRQQFTLSEMEIK